MLLDSRWSAAYSSLRAGCLPSPAASDWSGYSFYGVSVLFWAYHVNMSQAW